MVRRVIVWAMTVLLLASFLTLGASATLPEGVSEGIEREYRDLLDSLPEGVAERLPEEMHPDGEATDFERVAEGVAEMSGFAYLLGEVGNVLSVEWGTAWRTLARTVGLLLISAVAEVLRRTFRSEALSRALSWGVSFALFAAVLSTLYAQLQKTARFLEQVTALVTGLLPLMAALHAMGGNVAVAAVQHSTLLLFLSICENVCGRTVMPMTGMCLSLTVSTVFSSGPSLRGLTALIKSSYTRTLGFVMLLLSFVLSTQTLLRAAADSLTARAAKFLAGNLIPVVGGALGDTFRTVASGVAFLKSTVGVGVMIVLFLMLLPVLISLLLTRLSFRLSLTVSDLLGCETESRLLNELVGIYGTLIAVVSMCTVFLIFALTLFVRVSAA
jgi:stage III sporulation protein AE